MGPGCSSCRSCRGIEPELAHELAVGAAIEQSALLGLLYCLAQRGNRSGLTSWICAYAAPRAYRAGT